MTIKEFEMFYFDDKTFISLCKQLEKELKTLIGYSNANAYDLRLVYQKFELFLSVYYHSRKRDDIDYKTELRIETAVAINQLYEHDETAEITEEYYSEHFLTARHNLERIMEDFIYQITMRNLAISSADATYP